MFTKHYIETNFNYNSSNINPINFNNEFIPINFLSTTLPTNQHTSIFKDDLLLMTYGLRYSYYVAYELLGFAHGDIVDGRNYNLMLDIEKVDNIEYVLFKTIIGDKIYRFCHKLSRPGLIPKIIIIDFGYSNLSYNGHKIKTPRALAPDVEKKNMTDTYNKMIIDIFGHTTSPDNFSLNKLFNYNSTPLTYSDRTTKFNSNTIITIAHDNAFPNSNTKIAVESSSTVSDEDFFNSNYRATTYDTNKIMTYTNIIQPIKNNEPLINKQFDDLIQELISIKL
jgi:hypothetical protein